MAENNQNKNVQTSGPKLNDQMIVRREKLDKIRALGVEPYGEKFEWDHHAADIRANAEELEKNETTVRIAGRIMIRRGAGKAAFAVLRDQTGDIQLYFRKDVLSERNGTSGSSSTWAISLASKASYSPHIPVNSPSAYTTSPCCPNPSVRCRKNGTA